MKNTLTTQDPCILQTRTFLWQRKEVAGLLLGDHEHDPAMAIEAPNIIHTNHAGREYRRHPRKRPCGRDPCQSALRRQGAQRGATEFPPSAPAKRPSCSCNTSSDAQGGWARRRGHQKYVPVQHRQRLGELTQAVVGKLQAPHRPRLPRRHVPRRGREDLVAVL